MKRHAPMFEPAHPDADFPTIWNGTAPDALSPMEAVSSADSWQGARRLPFLARVAAWLRAGRFDRMLAVGTPAPIGSALALHAQRLSSVAERQSVARSLRQCLRDAADPMHDSALFKSSRLPVHRENIASAEEMIDTVTLRLQSQRPVTACGMARLRLLLSDSRGPLYPNGRGDLEARLRAALAEL